MVPEVAFKMYAKRTPKHPNQIRLKQWVAGAFFMRVWGQEDILFVYDSLRSALTTDPSKVYPNEDVPSQSLSKNHSNILICWNVAFRCVTRASDISKYLNFAMEQSIYQYVFVLGCTCDLMQSNTSVGRNYNQ